MYIVYILTRSAVLNYAIIHNTRNATAGFLCLIFGRVGLNTERVAKFGNSIFVTTFNSKVCF